VTTCLALTLVVGLLVSTPAPSATIITLKDGRVMRLKEPPRLAGGRIVFTTVEGQTFSLAESDVLTIGAEPTPTPTPPVLNRLDSHSLGAIAQDQRQKTGKKAELAVRPTPSPKPTRTPRPPKKTPTPTPRPPG
jgi:hypothetical protein